MSIIVDDLWEQIEAFAVAATDAATSRCVYNRNMTPANLAKFETRASKLERISMRLNGSLIHVVNRTDQSPPWDEIKTAKKE